MRLGDRIRQIRDELGLTQGQLASGSSVSQGYLSQLENGEVKNPSAAVLLRVAQAMQIDPDELFEAAGYPTVRMLRQIYQDYESTVDADLLRYLGNLPRDRQRRLLLILRGMEQVLNGSPAIGNGSDWATPEASPPLTVRTSPQAAALKGAGSHPELTRARR
ncbi:MAG: helix-turn-helix transcriptional regulator [Chloroflexi bacterium]|nr:MAG: helix-turn-helix transcriptional regulator [Chloroflexota bacterium]